MKAKRAPASPVAKFESLDGAASTTKRKRVPIVRYSPDKVHSRSEDLHGYAIGQDLQENSPTFKTIIRAFEHGAIRTGPKIQVNTGDDAGAEAAEWFNGPWAKNCDGRDDMHLAEILALCSSSEKREGDCLLVFDDGIIENTGCVFAFSSDQVCDVEDWDKNTPLEWAGHKCEKGVIFDKLGRVKAYVVTPESGAQSKPLAEVTIVPAWHPVRNLNGSARLYKRPWKFNQRRGQADSWTIAGAQRDIHEMAAAELQSAKASAQIFAWIESNPDALPAIERAMAAANVSAADIEKILYGTGDQSGALAQNYKKLEGLMGGAVEYTSPGDTVKVNENNRPSGNVSLFGEWSQIVSGASMGLGRARSTGKAEASYTAYRGEELMTWEAFECEQKRLERRVMDFLIYKAITWGLAKGKLAKPLPSNWHEKTSVSWATMKEVDDLKSAMAQRMRLKNGVTTLSQEIGPNWKAIILQLAEECKFLRDNEIPASIFETVAGAAAPSEGDKNAD